MRWAQSFFDAWQDLYLHWEFQGWLPDCFERHIPACSNLCVGLEGMNALDHTFPNKELISYFGDYPAWVSRVVGSNFRPEQPLPKAVHRGRRVNFTVQSTEKFSHLHFFSCLDCFQLLQLSGGLPYCFERHIPACSNLRVGLEGMNALDHTFPNRELISYFSDYSAWVSRVVGSNFRPEQPLPKAVHRGRSVDLTVQSTEKFSHLHFFSCLDWLS